MIYHVRTEMRQGLEKACVWHESSIRLKFLRVGANCCLTCETLIKKYLTITVTRISTLLTYFQADSPKKTFSLPDWIKSFSQTFTVGGVLLTGLIAASYLLEGSAKFIFSTWGFM